MHFRKRVVISRNFQEPIAGRVSDCPPGCDPGLLRHVAISQGILKMGLGHTLSNPNNRDSVELGCA